MPTTKIVRRKAAMTVSEKALLDVTRIVGNQRDMLQKWLRRRETPPNRSYPADIGYPTLIRH